MNSLNQNHISKDRMDRLAEAISWVFHPLTVVIPTMLVVLNQQGISFWQALFWAFLSVCIGNLPLAALLFYGVRFGHYSDLSVSIREQRKSVYTVYGISTAILLTVLVLGKAPLILTACIIAVMLTTVIGFVINHYYTKLSLHSVGMAGCATVLLLTTPWFGVAMTACALLVAWARIRLKHHTPVQILIGWAIPALSVLVIFPMFHLLP
jgi:membrane-associated phospholipid phosphatase